MEETSFGSTRDGAERTHSGFVTVGFATEPVVSCGLSETQVFLRVGHAGAVLGIRKPRPIPQLERAIAQQRAQNWLSAGTPVACSGFRERHGRDPTRLSQACDAGEAVEASVKTEDSIYAVQLHYGEMKGVAS